MSDMAAAILKLQSDTRVEMIVATVTSTNPFEIRWNGTSVPNPPRTTLTFAQNDHVLCLRQGASFFVISTIVS